MDWFRRMMPGRRGLDGLGWALLAGAAVSMALRRATGLRTYTGPFLELGERSYALERLYNCRDNLDFAIQNALPQTADAEADSQLMQQLEKRREQFIEAMDDDLNTPVVISVLFD